MNATERLFENSQSPLVQRLGVGVAALVCVQQTQIIQRLSDTEMVAAERLFANGQRSPVQPFGVGVAALAVIQGSQIIQ